MRESAGRALGAALAALILGPAPVATADPCALPAQEMGPLAALDLSGDGGVGGTGVQGDGGVGGTGLRGDDSGIGGTGLRGDDSGNGGTGLRGDDSGIGGTGIFGTLTAFGSLCVNGLRVHYPDDAEVLVNGSPADVSALGVGQVLWIVATERDGRLETRHIEVHSAVTGRIEAVDAASRRLRVAGRDVAVPAASRAILIGAAGRRGFESLRTGESVDVSGHLDADGAVVASRVVVIPELPRVVTAPVSIGDLLANAPPLERLSIEGYVERRIGPERFLVGGLELDLSDRPSVTDRIDRGSRIRAVGRLGRDGSLRVMRPPRRPPHPLLPDTPAGDRPAVAPGGPLPRLDDRVMPQSDGAGRPPAPDAGRPPRIERIERVAPPRPAERPHRPERPLVPRIERPERFDRPRIERLDRPALPSGDIRVQRRGG